VGTRADGATIKEGSYLIGEAGALMQIVDGEPRPVTIRNGKGGKGILARDAKIIRALLLVRDAVREVPRAQAAGQPWPRRKSACASPMATSCALRPDRPHRRLGHGRPGDR